MTSKEVMDKYNRQLKIIEDRPTALFILFFIIMIGLILFNVNLNCMV